MRWLVATQPNPSGEGVIADSMTVTDGCLVFANNDGLPVITYAPGSWRFAFRDEDGGDDA